MTEIARRGVLAGAGAGLMSSLVSEANAQGAKPEFQANEYWTQKGDVKLYLYRKRMASKAGDRSGEKQPVVFLVHGSSISSRPSFDLTVPGKPGYVFSPFDASGGYVDVTGYTSGQKVKDPYSGKIFLVP